MTAKDHNRLLGIFHLIQGGMQAFSGLLLGAIYGILGIVLSSASQRPDDQFMGTLFIILACVFAPIILIFAGIHLMAGYKCFKEKPGARTWGIISSIISLPGIPIGTALGVYGLWFFFGEEGKHFHLEQGNQNYLDEANRTNPFQTRNSQTSYEPHSWK